MYAEQFGVDLLEAITRLNASRACGEAERGTRGQRSKNLRRVVVMFTRDGEKTIHPYIEDAQLREIVEVRQARATLQELRKAQTEANRVVSSLGFQIASGINVFENRVELYPTERAELEAALKENGLTLPAYVQVIGQ